MLTRLGKTMLAMQMATNSPLPQLYNDSITKGMCEFKDTAGTDRIVIPKFGYITYQLRLNLTDGNGGVAFGSGDTPATEEDYALDSIITSGISATYTGPTTVYDSENNKYVSRVEYTISNTGSEEVSISEMCIYRSLGYSSEVGGTRSSDARFIMDRSVLDTPVTIPAGEAAVIRYDFVYPNGEVEPEPEPDPEPDPEPGE